MISWFKTLCGQVTGDPAGTLGFCMLGLCTMGIALMTCAVVFGKPVPPLQAKEWQISDKFGLNCACKEYGK